ncbi:MAG: hypothetical protein NVSMB49_00900 [Ktedonobacteraceae bacterium]
MISHLSTIEIVEHYLSFFRARNHIELAGSPLVVPGNSTSFIIATWTTNTTIVASHLTTTLST